MTIAATTAATRYAVGALALAALAVSAPGHARHDRVVVQTVTVRTARVGEVIVIGSPDDTIAVQVRELDFSRCAREPRHATIFVHITGDALIESSDGDDVTRCGMDVLAAAPFDMGDDVSLMIPIDFETSTASSR